MPAALVRVCATLPTDFISFEYPAGGPAWWYDIVDDPPSPIVENGRIKLWDRPGTDVEIVPERAARYLSPEDAGFFHGSGMAGERFAMQPSAFFALLLFVGVNLLAALSGATFRPDDWYRRLVKPAWQPPDRLFGPVWSVLYLANAIAGWLVWRKTGLGLPILAYLASLALNAGWSFLFFGLRSIGGALCWILLLWLSILFQILLFWPVSEPAGMLLLPYLAWVTFATALNAELWRLNRWPVAANERARSANHDQH